VLAEPFTGSRKLRAHVAPDAPDWSRIERQLSSER
jgi:hypothetical protein